MPDGLQGHQVWEFIFCGKEREGGFLKVKVFKRRPRNLSELKKRISEDVDAMCVNELYKIQKWYPSFGHYFENLMIIW